MLAIVLFFGMTIVFAIPFQMLGMPSEGAAVCGIIGAVCCVAWIIANENNKRNPGPAPTVVQPEPAAAVDPSTKVSLNKQPANETTAQAYALKQAKAEQLEQSKRKLRENMQLISDISYSLEQAMGDRALGIRKGHYLAAFYSGVFYDIACGRNTTAEQGEALLTHLLSCCPETYFDTAAEVIEHAQANDSVGQLFHAMCRYPLIILEWASQTGRNDDGARFLHAFEGGIYAASEICESLYPGIGLDKWARKVGYDWFGELQKPI